MQIEKGFISPSPHPPGAGGGRLVMEPARRQRRLMYAECVTVKRILLYIKFN